MILGWGIAVIIIITVIMLLLRFFFKTAFKIISIIWLVLFLATIAVSVLIYADIRDMREKCPEMPPVFLLDDEGKILAGLRMNIGGENEGQSEKDLFISSLDDFQQEYDNDFDVLLEEKHCRIALFNIKVFDGIGPINVSEDVVIPEETIMDILRSDAPITTFIDYQAKKEGLTIDEKKEMLEEIEKNLDSDVQMKSMLFAGLFAKSLNKGGPAFATENLKNGNIKVYKETITFKILKHAPYSLMGEITSKMMGKEVDEDGSS